MTETRTIFAPDTTPIHYHSMGDGPVVLLIHGFLSHAHMNWINPGTAAALVSAGYRVLAPDLRGHGESGAPDTPASYPPDILAMDMEAVLAAESVTDYDLVGYSLGARTALRMVIRGARPSQLVLGGMGLAGILDSNARRDFFISAIEKRDTLKRGDIGYEVARFIKSTNANAQAAIHVLRSQVVSTAAELATVTMPALVIAGNKDFDNGSAAELATALPAARYAEIDGDHMSAVVNPQLATEIIAFLKA
jgi:pimeloyl-ACP methyl ester carboxylesterase